MKPIHINLASTEYVDRKLACIMMGATLFVLVVLSVLNIILFRSSHETLAVSKAKTEKMVQAQKKKEAGNAPEMTVNEKEIEITRKSTLLVNRMICKDVFPWERVLNAFETDLPDNIYLESIRPDDQFNKVILKGYATAMSEVSTYLKEKESADLFKKITLVQIDVDQNAEEKETAYPKPPVQFEIESTLNLPRLFPKKQYGDLWRVLITEQKDA